MRHISFSKDGAYDFAILLKENALQKENIQKEYLDPLVDFGMDTGRTVAYSLLYDGKKPSANCRKDYAGILLPNMDQLGIRLVMCCDSEYFKTLTKQRTAEPHLGAVLPCGVKGFEHINIAYGLNFQQFFYNPAKRPKLALTLKAIADHSNGIYVGLGNDILRSVSYPDTLQTIKDTLNHLMQFDSLTADIEAFSLKHYSAGIGSIAFAEDLHTSHAFLCDYKPCEPYKFDWFCPKDKKFKKKVGHGTQIDNKEVKALLRTFLENYKGKLIWHNATFDTYILIYELWMDDLLDQEGMLKGLEFMLKNFECTQLITYLATNTCAGNKLSLKEQAHAFAGNYAQEDIKDIRLIPAPILLEYNAIDTCATWYTLDRHYDTMVLDDQFELYTDVFKPSAVDIVQMQLTGMCLDMDQVLKVEVDIQKVADTSVELILKKGVVRSFVQRMIAEEVIQRNKDYKTKVITSDEAKFSFNPNSPKQLAELLYIDMKLPIIDLTDTKLPATGGKTLLKLLAHTDSPDYLAIIQALVDYGLANKMLSTFIKVFKLAPKAKDGMHYLFGSYKLGGTVSGRISSCLVGETEVQCVDGTKRLDAIQVGDLVPTHTGAVQPVLNMFDNGEHPVYRVTLQEGRAITCTSNHRLLTSEGFLSLEDLLHESESEIRRRVTKRNACSFSKLPQLAISPPKEEGEWEEFTGRKGLSYTSNHSGRQKAQNIHEKATATGTLRSSLTQRLKCVSSEDRLKFGGNSQTVQSTSSCTKRLRKRYNRECRVSTRVRAKTLLSKDLTKSQNKSSVPQTRYGKVLGPRRICSSPYTLLDGTRKQVQLRASSSDLKAPKPRSFTYGLDSTPYKRRQIRQQNKQLGSYDSSGAHVTPPRVYSPIIKIEYVGVRRVYDMEVAEDHCYLANGIFVHNSNPNMMNLPSGSHFAKPIKSCFVSPPGYIMVGLDFASLEDRISALTTKDPEKLKIYTDGYDGHSVRAFKYFGSEMEGIVNTVESINSIAKKYPKLRQKSKAPTFLLTYGGSYMGLMGNCGFSEEEAKSIESNYHSLYVHSDDWVQAKLTEATKVGYVTVAFGLRVRTPILQQVILGNRSTPREAQAEGRTAGNALGQSYGLLNSRASVEFMRKARKSEYANYIRPIGQIHDSMYFLIKDDFNLLHWVNTHLVKASFWQELSEIKHPDVHLGGELSLFHPTWKDEVIFPNGATKQELINVCKESASTRVQNLP